MSPVERPTANSNHPEHEKGDAMRVATLTFQSALNYGAALQAYALKEAIAAHGHECDVLNYKCPAIENSYQYFPSPVNPRSIVSGLINYSERHRRKAVFGDFAQTCLCLGETLGPSEVAGTAKRYDAFVVGSDQVWNPKLTDGDAAYYLSFAEGRKRISYAASAGNGLDDLLSSKTAMAAIGELDHVSVRESDFAERLAPIIGGEVSTVVDPVFLLSRDRWLDMATHGDEGKPYVLAYGLHEPSVYATAESMASKHGMRCLFVPQGRKTKCAGLKITAPSVGEFLGLIKNASAVVTDSFHVASFAIIFERPLLVQLKTKHVGMNSRLTTLLERAGVAGQVILPQDDIPLIDYADTGNKLAGYRDASLKWLEKSLNE